MQTAVLDAGFKPDPDSFYREEDLIARHGFGFSELEKARKSGALRSKATGRGRRVYQGQWLIDWLRESEAAR